MGEEYAADSFFQRYGRHTRDFRKHKRNRDNAGRRVHVRTHNERRPRYFDDAWRKKECLKCVSHWKPGHKCDVGSITENARTRLRKGDPHVYIVRDLLLGLEFEARKEISNEYETLEREMIVENDISEGKEGHNLDQALTAETIGTQNLTQLADSIEAELNVNVLSAATETHSNVTNF